MFAAVCCLLLSGPHLQCLALVRTDDDHAIRQLPTAVAAALPACTALTSLRLDVPQTFSHSLMGGCGLPGGVGGLPDARPLGGIRAINAAAFAGMTNLQVRTSQFDVRSLRCSQHVLVDMTVCTSARKLGLVAMCSDEPSLRRFCQTSLSSLLLRMRFSVLQLSARSNRTCEVHGEVLVARVMNEEKDWPMSTMVCNCMRLYCVPHITPLRCSALPVLDR